MLRDFSSKIDLLSKKIDSQGFLRSRARVARIGTQFYEDLGNVNRPVIEVIKSIPSFNNQIVSLNHPEEDVTIDNVKDYQIGFFTNARYKNGWIEGLITITDKEAIASMMRGDTLEFSCGYTADLIPIDGNPSYYYEMTDIVGNHIALVNSARAGSLATLIDSKKPIISSNTINKDINNTMVTKKEATETNEVAQESLEDTTSSPITETKDDSELDSLKAELASLQGLNDSLVKQLADTKKELEASQKENLQVLNDARDAAMRQEVKARVETWNQVSNRLKDSTSMDYGMSASEVRKMWLGQEIPDMIDKLASASEDYINGLFDAHITALAAQPTVVAVDSIDAPLVSALQQPVVDSRSKLEIAQAEYIKRIQNANR